LKEGENMKAEILWKVGRMLFEISMLFSDLSFKIGRLENAITKKSIVLTAKKLNLE